MVSLIPSFLKPKPKPKQAPKRRKRIVNFFDGFSERATSTGNGGFRGGQIDRLNAEWMPSAVGPNRMVQMNGQMLRQRAWDLYINNPFAQAVIDAIIDNVIECGLIPERDENWETAWRRWGGLSAHSTNDCDISRDQTIADLQRTWIREVFVGGGCLTNYITLPRRSQPIPLAIELISEDQFADYIDHFGRNPKTANPVYNGVEVDRATGRTLAWHVKPNHPNDLEYDPLETIRIPAENGRYAYFKFKARAKRGTTKLRTVVNWLHSIGYYTDNELINSDIKSRWAYMVKTSGDADLDWADLSDSDPETGTTDVYGNSLEKLQQGQIFRGYPGDEIEAVGPNVPGGDSQPWIILMLRIIAVGGGCSYEEAYRDYGKGSWSSIRAAMASDRKRFKPLQEFAINNFGNPTVMRFDNAAVSVFAEGFPSPSRWQAERDDAWDRQEWSVPGWESPNPKDDATADDIKLKNGSITHQQIQSRGGRNWKRHFAQREIEKNTPGYPEPQQAVSMPVASDSQPDSTAEPSENEIEPDEDE